MRARCRSWHEAAQLERGARRARISVSLVRRTRAEGGSRRSRAASPRAGRARRRRRPLPARILPVERVLAGVGPTGAQQRVGGLGASCAREPCHGRRRRRSAPPAGAPRSGECAPTSPSGSGRSARAWRQAARRQAVVELEDQIARRREAAQDGIRTQRLEAIELVPAPLRVARWKSCGTRPSESRRSAGPIAARPPPADLVGGARTASVARAARLLGQRPRQRQHPGGDVHIVTRFAQPSEIVGPSLAGLLVRGRLGEGRARSCFPAACGSDQRPAGVIT